MAGWRTIGASVRGRAHIQLDRPCQDALVWRVIETPDGAALTAALADGAGTADHSDLGANTAVTAALARLEQALQQTIPNTEEDWQALLGSTQAAAFESVRLLAEEQDQPLRSYACTLTCLAAAGGQLAVVSIGDGIVIAVDEAGELEAICRLQRGEYANETYFLTQEDAAELAQFSWRAHTPAAVAMLSDGLARLALSLPEQKPFSPFFAPLIEFASQAADLTLAAGQLAAFLDSERVNDRTDDDKSLLIAVGG